MRARRIALAYLHGPVRDTAWVGLGALIGAVLAIHAVLGLGLSDLGVIGPSSQVPPAARPGGAPPIPEMHLPGGP